MKISKTQLEALKKLKEGNFKFLPYMGRFGNAHYYEQITLKNIRVDTVHKLIDLGLAKRIKEEHFSARHEVAITEKGIRFLEEMK